ncbi:hypothetical protein HHK36_030438 [Tetracentron sinense]|uniref:Amino acid transporter transmembrane domain-containing protein n=1 Tax=Tetracentron sinense TaxID=13715 RepID=A0A835CYQ4_TETSI|nr:hypothetical protein HHK36_030438 [Tetracentron sinense]
MDYSSTGLDCWSSCDVLVLLTWTLFDPTLYLNLFGVAIGYTIAASISMKAIKRSNCFHESGEKKTGNLMGSFTGISVGTVTQTQKIWRSFQALGDIACAYSYSTILIIEIQDTIKSPPSELKTMKKATLLSVAVTMAFYMLCGCMGSATFGDRAPGNLLIGFGFYKPFWVLDITNAAIVINLVSLPSLLPTPLRLHREMGIAKMAKEPIYPQRNQSTDPGFPSLQPQRLPLGMVIGIRGLDDHHIYAPPILQRRSWAARCIRVLAIHYIFSS